MDGTTSSEGAVGDAPHHEDAALAATRTQIAGIEAPEIIKGARSGSRFGRVVRREARRFLTVADPDVLLATPLASAPRTPAGRALARIRRAAVGSPISSEHSEEQRLPKTKALAVFSSDALSSSAYATDEILLYLSLAGTAALVHSLEIAAAIVLLLAIVAFSYRQTIRAYPNGGGAYIVARENLGDAAGLSAAAALAVDYVLTVSVSIAAGVLAITSAFPELGAYRIEMAAGFIAVVTLANLRGVKESGTIFAIPTYGFIAAMGALLVVGFVRVLIDPGLRAPIASAPHEAATSSLTLFIVLRAFASGCAALTGVEAISNGVPAFQEPESRNAAATLTWMAVILATLFFGITLLAHQLHLQHSPEMSAPAQIAMTVFGDNLLFYGVQFFTALILILAANTAYADFPRLGSILARDKFMPHHFAFRGDRLAFSNGIIVLGVAAIGFIVAFDANLNRLIPLYAFGVFASFTLSQVGMVVHWLRSREAGWRASMMINALGGTATGVVAGIIGITKFGDGAWISMLLMAALALAFAMMHIHYTGVERRLRLPDAIFPHARRTGDDFVVVLVDRFDRTAVRAIEYARALSASVTAVYVTDDDSDAKPLESSWRAGVLGVPLVVIRSPFRAFVEPVLAYIDAVAPRQAGSFVTVVLPEYHARWPWQRVLHNQTARRLHEALLDRPRTAVARVRYRFAD
jgi:amino acid transporter